MEIRISAQQLLLILQIFCWIVFVGISIEAGGIIFNMLYTSLYNPVGADFFYNRLNFSSLYHFDKGYLGVITFIMSIVSVLKATMFYLIIHLLNNKNQQLTTPFSHLVRKLILNIAFVTIGIAFFSNMGKNYTKWLVSQGVIMPSIEELGWDGTDVWFFMSMVLFIIAFIFKRGIQLQEDNDLTI